MQNQEYHCTMAFTLVHNQEKCSLGDPIIQMQPLLFNLLKLGRM